jgi:hypothetical protein
MQEGPGPGNWRVNKDMVVERVAPGGQSAAEWLRLLMRCYPDRRFRGGQPRDEPALLAGRHLLSQQFEFAPLLAKSPRGDGLGRCALAFYDHETTAYLGFFECLETSAAAPLFEAARAAAAERGVRRLVGPVDASFWLGYRMKLDHFQDAPYFGEPYNHPHYPELWSNAGFRITERYSSTIYETTSGAALGGLGLDPAGLAKKEAELGVTIRPLRRSEFDWAVGQIFDLVMTRYAGLPEFRPLKREHFEALFGSLKHVLDYGATMIGVVSGRIVGFATSTPDYGRALDVAVADAGARVAAGARTVAAWRQGVSVVRHRLGSRRYICHYMAVAADYHGLGPVLADAWGLVILRRRAGAIGSLIHESVPTSGYRSGAIVATHSYALWAADL